MHCETDDEKWLQQLDQIENDEDGFNLLIEKMGVFRWQSAHGFRTGQNRGLSHLKPIRQNVKEYVRVCVYEMLSLSVG